MYMYVHLNRCLMLISYIKSIHCYTDIMFTMKSYMYLVHKKNAHVSVIID